MDFYYDYPDKTHSFVILLYLIDMLYHYPDNISWICNIIIQILSHGFVILLYSKTHGFVILLCR